MGSSVFAIAASLFLVTAAVNLEMPLYRTYAQAAGYGNGLTALVFAAYIAGLLPVLILLGGISDRLGRKPVIFLGLGSAMLATGLMIVSPTMHALFIARILLGVGVGLSVGAATAYLAEIVGESGGHSRTASYVAITTSLGFGGGALFTSTTLIYEKTLVPYSYWVVFILTLVCMALVLRLPNRKTTPTSLLRLPHFPAGTVAVGVAIAVAWSVTGLVIALVPAQLARHELEVWSGLALFLINGTGASVQPLARRLDSKKCMRIGFILIPLGYIFLVTGAWFGILSLVLIGAAIAGSACYGFTYLGGLAEVVRVGGAQRARTVSGYFLSAYLGFGLPSILMGYIADMVGVMSALVSFGILVLIICSLLAFRFR